MKPNKLIALAMILVFVAPVFVATSGCAQVPSTPQFTVQYLDRSYDVPPTYGIDPYTGKTIIKSGGYHQNNQTIDVTIQNQPFTPYLYGNETVYLSYTVRSKGHYATWETSDSGYHSQDGIKPSSGSDTVVTFFTEYWGVPSGGQLDFQVKAVLSYTINTYSGSCFTGSNTNTVAESQWSGTATITIGDSTPASASLSPITSPNQTPLPVDSPTPIATAQPTSNPTATPSRIEPNEPGPQKGFGFDLEQTALIVMAVIVVCLVIVVALLLGRVVNKKLPSSPSY